jgi:hypothetical protein
MWRRVVWCTAMPQTEILLLSSGSSDPEDGQHEPTDFRNAYILCFLWGKHEYLNFICLNFNAFVRQHNVNILWHSSQRRLAAKIMLYFVYAPFRLASTSRGLQTNGRLKCHIFQVLRALPAPSANSTHSCILGNKVYDVLFRRKIT